MSKIDVLLVTPPSRLEVYQELSGNLAAIEPPVWSSLIATHLLKKQFSVKILDAEAENLNHEQTNTTTHVLAPFRHVFDISSFTKCHRICSDR